MPRADDCNGKLNGEAQMLLEWRSFLENAGATIIADRTSDFGNPTVETQIATSGEVIADLSHRALITVKGADAEKFIQGQLTNDFHNVTEYRSQLSAHCSPKGRVLACFRVFRRNDIIYLALPESLLESSLQRLRKYVLMSNVELDVESSLAQIGYSAAKGIHHLRNILKTIPEEVDMVTHSEDITVIQVPGPYPRYELLGPVAALKVLWTKLDVHAAPIGAGPWSLLDIFAGLPELCPETVDAFIPQMINLDVLNGISFRKGCYTGQEIVARTHYLGKLKRRMFRLHSPTTDLPEAGTRIYIATQHGGESVGTIITAQPAPEGGTALLAVLQIDATTLGELRLGQIDGSLCTLQTLPYSLEISEN
jgi:tRNA-modifying protein YgfZ